MALPVSEKRPREKAAKPTRRERWGVICAAPEACQHLGGRKLTAADVCRRTCASPTSDQYSKAFRACHIRPAAAPAA